MLVGIRKQALKFVSLFGFRKLLPLIKIKFKGNPIFFVPTKEKICFMTLDDAPGPDENINQELLKILKEYQVKATFFMISSHIKENHQKMFIKNLLEDGHEIANHMQFNESAYFYSKERFEKDLLSCENILNSYDKEFSNKKIKLFRPPYGKISNVMLKLLKQHNYTIVLGDLYSYDYYISDVSFHVNYIKKNMNNGSIIILHCPSNSKNYQTLDILKNIIPFIQKAGFRFEILRKILESSN